MTHSFEQILENESDNVQASFREFYDLTCLTCSIRGTHPWYKSALQRLHEIWKGNEEVWKKIFDSIEEEKRLEIPIEVIVRQDGIKGIGINIFDLVGNAFAHDIPQAEIDDLQLPQIIKSNGVYW